MNNRILVLVVILLIPVALVSSFRETSALEEEKPSVLVMPEVTVRLKLTATEEIIEIPLEEYIIGVVAAEMPALFHEEALKAQAIASRSYALSKLDINREFDLVDTVANQVYISVEQMKEKWEDDFEIYYERIKSSVEATRNMVLVHNNQIIIAYYFAMSNGFTEYSELVFLEARDYLKSVESVWDNDSVRNYSVETRMSRREFCDKLEVECRSLSAIITDRSDSNRVNEIKVNNTIFRGTDFRHKLGLRSTDFDIEIRSEFIYITTRGHGHGVGMSQRGANGMANAGKTFQEILKHFYQNVEIIELKNV